MARDLGPVEDEEQLGLAGVEAGQQAVEGDEAGAAPEDAIEAGAQLADAETIEMGRPSRFIGESRERMGDELADHRGGEVVFVQVGKRGVVEDVVVVAGAQDLQEVPSALGETGGEEGEAIVRSGWSRRSWHDGERRCRRR